MVVAEERVLPSSGDNSVSSIVPAVLTRQSNSLVSEEMLAADAVVLFVVDGMGWHQIDRYRDQLPCLGEALGAPITTVAPSTTATALTSICTGVLPGEHGVIGYKVDTPSGLLNCLRWTSGSKLMMRDVPPIDFQPVEPFLGGSPPVVTRAEFQKSGFTQAHLRNGRFCGWWSPATLVTEIDEQLRAGAPFVYAYYDALDKVAHVHGLGRHYLDELKFVDALVERIVAEVPEDVTLLVTADHGMVEVGDKIFDIDDELVKRTSRTSGEARFLWLHAKDDDHNGLLKAAEIHSDVAWVAGIDQVLDECWFGLHVTPEARMRMGEVAIVAREPVALMDPRQPDAPNLVARHGSMTEEEMHVPFLAFS